MAIMRTDTDIKSWQQLKGRTVCLSEGGRYVGALTRQYGAVEIVFKAPADSWLALRTGECDAAVHDYVLLKALSKLPEWTQFAARLPWRPAAPLTFLLRPVHALTLAVLKGLPVEWRANRP